MTHIIVDDQQAKIIAGSSENIEIRDRKGQHLGYVAHGFGEDDIAIATQRATSTEARYTTQQVLDHLQSLGQQ